MHPNRAFWRAMHSLAHPISIVAVLFVIFNDHLFRILWPSWWTGKIGDFAWLTFIPFVVALVLALLIPSQWQNQERTVARLTFIMVVFGFGWVKMTPMGRNAAIWTLETLGGWETNVVMDPTDLFTLPAILISWLIWNRVENHEPRLSPRAWIVLALGIVATLATGSEPPVYNDAGITCILEQHDSSYPANVALVTYTPVSYYSSTKYISLDGGLTWRKASPNFVIDRQNVPVCPENKLIYHPDDGDIQYRVQPGQPIMKSSDGGATWSIVHELPELRSEIRYHYHMKHDEGSISGRNVVLSPGPFSAIFDTKTGYAVFAMGWEGVLVNTADNEWHWADVGEIYRLENLQRLDIVFSPLMSEILLAVVLSMVMITTCGLMLGFEGLNFTQVSIEWLLWLSTILLPLLDSFLLGTSRAWTWLDLFALISYALVFGLAAISAMITMLKAFSKRFRYTLLPVLAASCLTTLLFLFPYALWSWGTVPKYNTALLYSFALVAASLYATGKYLERYPRVKANKVKDYYFEMPEKDKLKRS